MLFFYDVDLSVLAQSVSPINIRSSEVASITATTMPRPHPLLLRPRFALPELLAYSG